MVKESTGEHKGVKIFCPVNAFGDCCYCSKDNICYIEDPIEECCDFKDFFSSWAEWENL